LIGAVFSGNSHSVIQLLTYPWEAISAKDSASGSQASSLSQPWCAFVVTDVDAKLENEVTGSTFPSTQISDNTQVYEIHGPALKGELSKGITISTLKESLKLEYILDNTEIAPINKQKYEPFFDHILDSILLILREGLKNENFRQENHYWGRLLDTLLGKDQDDPAKYSLVVDLARPKTFLEPLNRITERPKRVLRRIHDQERVQKVREIDTKCVVDLAKRPGAAIAEKAGPKQRILAIRRTESIDILENRVAQHACSLADRASRRYLAEYGKWTGESERVGDVERLQRSVLRLPKKQSFDGVTSLIEPCRQPNYTLLQNTDYYRVWQAYVELVKNEDLRNQMWLWNRRLWRDYMTLFLSHAIQQISDDLGPETLVKLNEKTILGNRKHQFGQWLLDDILPGPFVMDPNSESPGSLYLLDGSRDTLTNADLMLKDCALLNADFCVIMSREDKISVLPVYCVMPSPHLDSNQYAEFVDQLLPSLLKGLKQFSATSSTIQCIGGWVLLGNWGQHALPPIVKNLQEGITCWLSEISSDSSCWNESQGSWENPLLGILGN
jgi:hypothetical protein